MNKSTVYQLCKEGQLRGFYIGSIHSKKPVLRIRREDLENYMERAGGEELER
ncbi:helix-turn-helix domain-containing protein [Clostridium sp.]|uniref:helix-turn-helix domain-containing protein n=1 Tax=Clostridium sp. TaxID=1506 RepID=UPI0035A0352F